MIKTFLCAAMLCLSYFTYGQTGVFKTYEDYAAGQMEAMQDNVRSPGTSFGVIYVFTTMDGGNKKYKAKEIWGFVYKGHLFRSDGRDMAMLMDTGKVWYYLNGQASVGMLHSGKNYSVSVSGPPCHLSAPGINSEMYGMPLGPFDQKDFKKMKKDHPEFEEIYKCMGPFSTYETTRKCVKQFNEEG